jgi:hypothetical protein
VTGVYLPNSNVNTNTNTNTTTNTLTRYVTNTSTSTNTVTNTSTNTNTNTITATTTYVDDDSVGVENYVASGDGSGDLVTDFQIEINQDITQDFILGDETIGYINNDGNFVNGNGQQLIQQIEQEIPIFYEGDYADYDAGAAFYNIIDPTNPNVDLNQSVDLGSNITIVEVLADGFVEIQQDFVQTINQDIIQDIFYEVDLIQDIVQDVDINQTYTVDQIITETRTRLVGE